MDYDVFNGDADGICALLQLRKEEPREASLVTGVKRDINLLARVSAAPGDRITVLDVSMDKNSKALEAALERGGRVLYVDHHFPGEIPEHPGLRTIIDQAPEVCTATLVDGYLQGRQRAWAVTGAFGDNLGETARRLAASLELCAADLDALEQLGTCINYNGYGPSLADLYFDPAQLYCSLYEADGPLEFVRDSADFGRLSEGYREDMAAAAELQPLHCSDLIAVYLLPDEPWARRVSGVFSNDLASDHRERAHAVLTEKSNGNYLVSVRAPLSDKRGAAKLCMQFPTGGGRAAAAGINDLPRDSLEAFIERFGQAYGR